MGTCTGVSVQAAEIGCLDADFWQHVRPADARARQDSSSRHAARQTRASTRRSRRAVSICSLIVTRPSGQPRSENWTLQRC